ncbi:MAG: hypothetical protein A2Y12_10280 [Planctomycetes bacterium GWF2_42_9]|nr:MAG: hypothetical protein A2Y12_10280 [Planctomycetes bacterium GWF2_42_9]
MNATRIVFAQVMDFLPLKADFAQVLIHTARNTSLGYCYALSLNPTAHLLRRLHLPGLKSHTPELLLITIDFTNFAMIISI